MIILIAFSLIAVPMTAWAFSMKSTSIQKKTDGKTVYKYITQTEPYKKWALWPGKGEFYKGLQPHGAFLTTYVSKGALKTINKKTGSFPNGAILVKENYTPKKELDSITVMYRVKGYNPDAGDWFWAKYAADGTVQAEGNVKGCINCHSIQKMNDWVYTGPIK